MSRKTRRNIKKHCKTKNWTNVLEIIKSNNELVNILIDKRKKRNVIHILSHNLALNVLR